MVDIILWAVLEGLPITGAQYNTILKGQVFTMDYAYARHLMIEAQVRTNKVINPAVLDALRQLPREDFLPPALKPLAYTDAPLKISPGHWMLAPMLTARLLQEACFEPHERVLHIGANTGYTSVLLSRLTSHVTAIEENSMLRLPDAYQTPSITWMQSLPEKSQQFDCIYIDGGFEALPAGLADYLTAHGRIIGVEMQGAAFGHAICLQKSNNMLFRRIVFDACAEVLPGFAKKSEFAL
jgi:protein-L-isoaspartate(D-aspartate) O-methyltransferase